MIANTPKPRYFAVIFSSVKSDITNDYDETAQRMEKPARQQDDF
jgi:hypothetical protein